jgi:cytochrome c-type biogenesis protein CcmE
VRNGFSLGADGTNMNKIRQRKLMMIVFFLVMLSIATSLILFSLKQNINVFVTPKQIAAAHLPLNYHFRLGGMVKPASVIRDKEGLGVQFVVTDYKQAVTVRYVGVLPDLFREGKGVIAEGSMNAQGIFIATQVLAKHDENYMPKNVYKALRENNP